MKIKIYNEGIKKSENGLYIIDYNENDSTDLIYLENPQLYKSSLGNHTYWFGYKFNPEVSSKERTEFINYIKRVGENKISDKDLEYLITRPLFTLDKVINLYNIDAFIYPLSNRSKLVTDMVRVINGWTSREMVRMSFELVKSIPTEISFDWDTFNADYGDDLNKYNQMVDYVKDILLPKIHSLDYFSLAHNVKPKYRSYITNFINFKDNDIDKISSLKEGSNILIVDDINTSGSTIKEIIRKLNKLNSKCNIFIYTLIGK